MAAEPKSPRALTHLFQGFADPESAGALVGILFDFAIDQPVARYVEPEKVLGHVERALQPAFVERWVRDHLRPWLDRERTRAHARGDVVKDWLTPEAIAELRSFAARPVKLNKAFLEGLVKQDAVRHMLRGIVEETLDRFVTMMKPGGSGGGLVGAMGRGAFGIAGSLGKGVLGGISGQIESQLRGAIGGFLDSSMSFLLDRVVALASSPDTAARLGRMNLTGFDEALKVKTGRVADGVHQAPLDDLLGTLPELLAHNIARPELRDGLLDEVRAWLEVEGARTVRQILDEAGATQHWRDEIVAVGGPLLGDASATEAFRAWFAAHAK
jgi:hypothetical protein